MQNTSTPQAGGDRPLDATIASPDVTATQDPQAANCLALHAYAVDNTYAVVRDGQKLL